MSWWNAESAFTFGRPRLIPGPRTEPLSRQSFRRESRYDFTPAIGHGSALSGSSRPVIYRNSYTRQLTFHVQGIPRCDAPEWPDRPACRFERRLRHSISRTDAETCPGALCDRARTTCWHRCAQVSSPLHRLGSNTFAATHEMQGFSHWSDGLKCGG